MRELFWHANGCKRLKQVKEILETNPTTSNREIAEMFNTSLSSVEGMLRREGLRRKRLIREVKPMLVKPISTKTLPDITPLDWKIITSKRNCIKGKPYKTILCIADSHVPHQNIPAINALLQLMDDLIFDGIYIVGDFMDMEPIAHWLHDSKSNRTLENKRMINDYIEGNKLLDEFDKRLPKEADKRYWMGNHERFYWDLIEKVPALEGLLDPEVELKLKERGYTVYPVNHIERVGRLSICHGQYHNQNYVLKHINEFKTNVLHADMHSPRMRFENSPAKEIAIAGYCLGCLCDTNPLYMKNKPNKWSHGFAVLYLYEEGYFDIDLKRIVNSKFVYNNKMYDGNYDEKKKK